MDNHVHDYQSKGGKPTHRLIPLWQSFVVWFYDGVLCFDSKSWVDSPDFIDVVSLSVKYLMEEVQLLMYTMETQYYAGMNNLPVGALFLNSIVRRAPIDSKAKVLVLRDSVLHHYINMVELKGNIWDFNQYLSKLRSSILGQGQEVSELVINLFKAYKHVPDEAFGSYIEGIRNCYYAEMEDQTAEGLMLLAVNKYYLLEQRDAMPTENIEKIVALQTMTKSLSTTKDKNNRNCREDA
jgi:hypothetical protein